MSVENGLDYKLPSSPKDRESLKSGIDSVRNAFVRIQSENEFIKETVKELSKTYELPTEQLRKLAKDLANDAFSTRVQKEEAYQELYLAYTSIVDKNK